MLMPLVEVTSNYLISGEAKKCQENIAHSRDLQSNSPIFTDMKRTRHGQQRTKVGLMRGKESKFGRQSRMGNG